MNIIKKIKVYELAECVFFILLGLYLLFLAESTTTFNFEYTTNVEELLLNSLKIVTILKLLLFLWSKRHEIISDKILASKMMVLIICAVGLRIVYYMVYQSDKYKFLVFLGVLTLGSIGSDYKKIMKVHVITVGLMTGAAVLGSLTGFIINYTYLKEGGFVHSSWGIVYSTDYASLVLFLCITAWIAWKDINSTIFFVLGILCVLNSAFIARSNTSTTIGVLFLVVVLFEKIKIKKEVKLGTFVFEMAFPIFAFITFFSTFLYHKGTNIGIKLNSFFHGRLRLLDDGINNYNISLFGKPFAQSGGGGSTYYNSNYNFIDSTYGLILLRYGVILFASIMILWVVMTRKAIKMGDWRLAFGMGLIAFHSFSEHHFPEVNYNVIMILPFSILGMRWLVNDKKDEIKQNGCVINKKSFGIGFLTIGITALLIILGGPFILSLFRTFFDVTDDVIIKNKEILVCLFFMAMIIACIIAVVALYKLLYLAKNRCDKSNKRAIILPSIIVMLAIISSYLGVITCKRIINKKGRGLIAGVESEESAITAVKTGISASGGEFYVDDIPYIYQKIYGCVTNGFLQGDELANTKNTTVLMDADYEASALINMGFLYTEISDEHALYSNDESVIKELEEVGYHLTGYFSRKLMVNLKEEAERNDLDIIENGSVAIGGDGKALRYGPYFDLRSANYTVSFDISLHDIDDYQDDYKVCTLIICVNWGTRLAEVPVFRSDFDEKGNICVKKRVNINESRGCEFKVYPENGSYIILNSITCQKTPDIDIHNAYDRKGRVVRTEYYDLEGNPIDTSGGYQCVEYQYNSMDIPEVNMYFDKDGKPVITTSGYAAIKYKYDNMERVIKETYYDVDGAKIIMAAGHSAVEYGYDRMGNRYEYRYYDVNDKLVNSGYAILRRTFDDKNRIILEEYFDAEYKPYMIKDGYAKIGYGYDDADREICRCFYGEDGKLTASNAGYAQRWRILDNEGRTLREEYYGTDGKRIAVAGECAIIEYNYDMYGNQTDIYYYDEFDKPVLHSGLYFHIHRDYNTSHQITRETIYDLMNNAIVMPEGYVTVEKEYDKAGNVIVYRYLNENGSAVLLNNGYAEVDYLYNEKNQVIKVEYRDESGEYVVLPDGYTIVEFEYDENGNQAYESYYDKSGKPVAWRGEFYKRHRVYNEHKQVIREEFCDEFGGMMERLSGFAALEREYDSSNHITKEYYLGLNNEPVNCTNGYSIIEYTYDSDGNLTSTVYYNTKGEVVEQK